MGDSGEDAHADIVYEFVVDGVTILGKRITYGNIAASIEYLDEYPSGKTVQVYHNPDDPSECVLVPEVNSDIWDFLLLGFGSIGITGYVGLRMYLEYRQLAKLKQADGLAENMPCCGDIRDRH
jgi:hypothetical protein